MGTMLLPGLAKCPIRTTVGRYKTKPPLRIAIPISLREAQALQQKALICCNLAAATSVLQQKERFCCRRACSGKADGRGTRESGGPNRRRSTTRCTGTTRRATTTSSSRWSRHCRGSCRSGSPPRGGKCCYHFSCSLPCSRCGSSRRSHPVRRHPRCTSLTSDRRAGRGPRRRGRSGLRSRHHSPGLPPYTPHPPRCHRQLNR